LLSPTEKVDTALETWPSFLEWTLDPNLGGFHNRVYREMVRRDLVN